MENELGYCPGWSFDYEYNTAVPEKPPDLPDSHIRWEFDRIRSNWPIDDEGSADDDVDDPIPERMEPPQGDDILTFADDIWHDFRCPYCEREERVSDHSTGLAWLQGHIRAEHDDELPPVEGTPEPAVSSEDYDPGNLDWAPHHRRKCNCGREVITVGWEVTAVLCPRCDGEMEWVEDLHDPRTDAHHRS